MSNSSIHPTSIVEAGAKIGDRVNIGPFCHIGPEAVIGNDVTLLSHVVIMGATTLGDGAKVYPNATLVWRQ